MNPDVTNLTRTGARAGNFPRKPAHALSSPVPGLSRPGFVGYSVRAAPRDDTFLSDHEREDFTIPEGVAVRATRRERFGDESRLVQGASESIFL